MNYNYTLASESTDFQKDGHIQVNQRTTVSLASTDIYYIDFETHVHSKHKFTGANEPLLNYPPPIDINEKVYIGFDCLACKECMLGGTSVHGC